MTFLQKHWRYGLLLLPAVVLAIVIATAATAKPKPPTTTSTTTTTTTVPPAPTLGIPHEVVRSGLVGNQAENIVLCPAGEVALSITFSEPGPMYSTTFYADPITDTWSGEPSDRPNGYVVYSPNPLDNHSAHLLCAPVVQ
jgi:hypothetical protein